MFGLREQVGKGGGRFEIEVFAIQRPRKNTETRGDGLVFPEVIEELVAIAHLCPVGGKARDPKWRHQGGLAGCHRQAGIDVTVLQKEHVVRIENLAVHAGAQPAMLALAQHRLRAQVFVLFLIQRRHFISRAEVAQKCLRLALLANRLGLGHGWTVLCIG
jgi:hypothetical protein